jgi:hypothetical protein
MFIRWFDPCRINFDPTPHVEWVTSLKWLHNVLRSDEWKMECLVNHSATIKKVVQSKIYGKIPHNVQNKYGMQEKVSFT